MDEQRMQAYVKLIEQLLGCASGEELGAVLHLCSYTWSRDRIGRPTPQRLTHKVTEERQRAGGRSQKIYFLPSATGFEAPKFIYEKQKNMCNEWRSARNTTSELNPLNLFMGITSCLLPSSSCLLNLEPA